MFKTAAIMAEHKESIPINNATEELNSLAELVRKEYSSNNNAKLAIVSFKTDGAEKTIMAKRVRIPTATQIKKRSIAIIMDMILMPKVFIEPEAQAEK